ncbi:MAG: hypothetical protein U0165_02025 [Polyangiaceae bacterium]
MVTGSSESISCPEVEPAHAASEKQSDATTLNRSRKYMVGAVSHQRVNEGCHHRDALVPPLRRG